MAPSSSSLATLVTLCAAMTGEPIVQVAKCGAGHEKTLTLELVDALPPGTLDGAIVGGDPLFADTALVRQLVQEQGAITLVQLKDNQPKAAAEKTLAENPAFFRTEPELGHGRIDQRQIRGASVTPEKLGFVHAAQLLEIQRESTCPIKTTGPLLIISPGLPRWEIVLSSDAKSETPKRNGGICVRAVVKYSALLDWRLEK